MPEQEESWQTQLGIIWFLKCRKEDDQEDVQNPKGMMIVNGQA